MTDIARKLHNHILSGIGITAIRTRDPVATINAAIAFCASSQKPIRIWDPARGWLAKADPIQSDGDGKKGFLESFQALLTPQPTDEYPGDGVFVYTMLHHHISDKRPNPEAFQLLATMAYNLPTTKRRVLLCVPPSYTLPPELRELIPVVEHEAPDVAELTDCVHNVMEDLRGTVGRCMPKMDADGVARVAQAGVGMIALEFENALSRVLYQAKTDNYKLTPEDLRARVLLEKAEVVKRSRALEVMPAVHVDDVGGLGPLKSWVRDRIPAMDPEAWEAGVDKPKGCALVGPPGTGKSLLGKVIGGMLGVATIRFDVSAVFSGLVGSSEENMREALFMLKSLAPCVVLLDEVDKALSTQASGDSGVGQKVLGSLLTFMQETQELIFWVPTLNRTQNVPAEFLRAGRLDEVFGVALPNAAEREAILTVHLRKRKVDPESVGSLSAVVGATEGFVGAELENVVKAARLAAYTDTDDDVVTIQHMMEAAAATRPLSAKMADQFSAMQEWCKQNAAPANDPEATVPQTPTRTRPRAVE